jgi:hypothetical protein
MKSYTIRIRVQGTSFQEVQEMTIKLEALFPNLMFSSPREGKNPKYAGNQMWASYSRHRVKHGRELAVNI